ncbi:hypothetical protein CcarbDRAFT_4779 [Clostridium carboxidivorans P7]|uniref:Uncharacterized protein n=1 Tax=Clostridium carboxidivorans P7 TaxID=536227 RepID=C6Q162_9CLOT|nr:hypothetical protein CcarbDRAFT_4779 [Clostridium carboxidivorans P7]
MIADDNPLSLDELIFKASFDNAKEALNLYSCMIYKMF